MLVILEISVIFAHILLEKSTNLILIVVKDEEEVPPESGTEGKDKEDKEEAEKDKQDESEKKEAEERAQKAEETGSKTEPKVRAVISAEQGGICTAFMNGFNGRRFYKTLLSKVEQDNKTNGDADAEKKAKPKKKSKLSEDITVELLINDILDPTTDDLTSSKKK